MTIDKTYNPSDIEARISTAWDEAQAFRAGRPERAGAETFSIVIPPPNVTGSLHMGHALNNTLQDVLVRFERMRGKDVLWQPGTDHAGIATQMVVERQLAERQEPDRRTMGRAAFLERVWTWKEESGGTIMRQLRRLGASCDFSRERFTMDEGLSRAVRKVFVELHKAGLIYKDKRLVNWDPKFQTAISDLEVQQVETKGHLWHLRYPIEGEPGRFIVVATTRPETMLGDTAVAVHPEDGRYRDLIGKNVILPLVGRRIPIVGDEYSDPEKGSGAVKITPAHDFNDFEVGRRHGLPLVSVLDKSAALELQGNEDFLEGAQRGADLDAVLALHGQDRAAARKSILALLEKRELVEKIEPHAHSVPHGDRSGVVIEPFLTDQWYVDAHTLAQPALAAVREGRANFVPKNWEKTYFDWLENIQPWCVSRQLWWGHQIPAWYDPYGNVFVEETEEEAVAAAILFNVEHGNLSADEADALSRGEGTSEFLHRDEDVLDTWFSSALWPFSTLGWPDDTPEGKRYYPTSVLVTGFDIIFFWVARMMMMGLHFMDEVPFKDIYIHALVRDEKGAKMSKSKGNVIDPLDLMDEYGADAVRFTLAAMAAQGRDIKLARSRIEGYRNFATKLWNATRFAEMNGCAVVPDFDPQSVETTLNRWIVGQCAAAIAETTTAIENYRFNDAAGAVYRFVWSIFCDWYLELAKPVLQSETDPTRAETQAVLSWVLDQILRLLHPFMPFLTEELWQLTAPAGGRGSMLVLADWPVAPALDTAEAEAEIGWLIDLVSEVRSVRTEMNISPGAQIPLVLVGAKENVVAWAGRYDAMLKRLARLSSISYSADMPAGAIQLLVRGGTVALPIADVIDLAAERARLDKELGKIADEIGKIDKKLGNPDFLSRAREEVVEEQHERRAEAEERRSKLNDALVRLGSIA